jgi:glycine dehydrogenase subunit 1
MNLPKPLQAEWDLKRHVENILAKNKTCSEYLNFLGAGCWSHYVPAVCDEISRRAEFLTAYAGLEYSDLGKYQSFFEFQSMIGELLEMDVVGVPTYDWGTAAGNAIRMASRITGRNEILIAKTISPSRLSILKNFCQPKVMPGHIDVKLIAFDGNNGQIDLEDLNKHVSSKTAGIYFENPNYLGAIEGQCAEITKIAHDHGAQSIVGVDPISLGVLKPPGDYGADIACGDIQPLGIHMYCGGGLGGFLACPDQVKYVGEHPSFLISITNTQRQDEYAFGQCRYDRTSFVQRENAKDWMGTTTGLWSIVAAVYMALIGPQGMREIGEAIIQKSHYAARCMTRIKGVRVPFSSFFKEFVVNFDRTHKKVQRVNKSLLKEEIFGGKDISKEFPELGQSALYCVTEIHSARDIKRLCNILKMVVD